MKHVLAPHAAQVLEQGRKLLRGLEISVAPVVRVDEHAVLGPGIQQIASYVPVLHEHIDQRAVDLHADHAEQDDLVHDLERLDDLARRGWGGNR